MEITSNTLPLCIFICDLFICYSAEYSEKGVIAYMEDFHCIWHIGFTETDGEYYHPMTIFISVSAKDTR